MMIVLWGLALYRSNPPYVDASRATRGTCEEGAELMRLVTKMASFDRKERVKGRKNVQVHTSKTWGVRKKRWIPVLKGRQ